MFGGRGVSAAGGASSSGGGANSIRFKAGKLVRAGAVLTADRRRGVVTIEKVRVAVQGADAQGAEGMLHFRWAERTSAVPEDVRSRALHC